MFSTGYYKKSREQNIVRNSCTNYGQCCNIIQEIKKFKFRIGRKQNSAKMLFSKRKVSTQENIFSAPFLDSCGYWRNKAGSSGSFMELRNIPASHRNKNVRRFSGFLKSEKIRDLWKNLSFSRSGNRQLPYPTFWLRSGVR